MSALKLQSLRPPRYKTSSIYAASQAPIISLRHNCWDTSTAFWSKNT